MNNNIAIIELIADIELIFLLNLKQVLISNSNVESQIAQQSKISSKGTLYLSNSIIVLFNAL